MKRYLRPLDLAVLLGVILSVLLANIAQFGRECDEVRADVVRLHILANSDSEADQKIKLLVRDRILSDVGGVFTVPQNKIDAQATAKDSLPAIRLAAQQTLRENGFDEPVSVELCNIYFPTREYDGLSLPAGNYDAVRVTIGAGAGKNWWCVMYPPICISAAIPPGSSVEMEEITRLNHEPMFKPKLAVVELFENLVG